MIMINYDGLTEAATNEVLKTYFKDESEISIENRLIDGEDIIIDGARFFCSNGKRKYRYSINGEGDYSLKTALNILGISKENKSYFTYYRMAQTHGKATIKNSVLGRKK